MMGALAGLLFSLAVVAVAGAGFATIVGLPALRDRCFGVAIILAVVALTLPLVAKLLGDVPFAVSGSGVDAPGPGGVAVFLLGHAALGVALFHRRRRAVGADRETRDIEQARGRGRPRLPPDGGEVES